MRESCTSGSVRGVLSNEHPYRDRALQTFRACKTCPRPRPGISRAPQSSLRRLRKLVCAAHAFGFPLWQNLSPASNGDHH